MNAPEDRLRFELADLAAEVRVVDLRDRALRTSRRLGIRRAVVTGAAVVAVVAIAAGAAFAIQVDRVPVPPPVDNNSTSPSPVVTPPSTSPVPSSGSSSAEAPVRLAGNLFYVNLVQADPNVSFVKPVRWAPGDSRPTELGLALGQLEAETSLTISPDGRKLAYIGQGDPLGLMVANVDGSDRRGLATDAEQLCVQPVWSPDGKRVLVNRKIASAPGGEQVGTVDVGTGTYRALPTQIHGCHVLWSADNSTLVYPDGSGQLYVSDVNGRNQRKVPGIGQSTKPKRACFDVESVSPDGSRVVARVIGPDEPAGDVARGLYANTVVDTRTGKAVDLPIQGKLIQAVYLADGQLLVRVEGTKQNRLVLLSPQLTVLDQRDEPAVLKTSTLLSHAPA